MLFTARNMRFTARNMRFLARYRAIIKERRHIRKEIRQQAKNENTKYFMIVRWQANIDYLKSKGFKVSDANTYGLGKCTCISWEG